MSLDRKVIRLKIRTISEPIYEDELLKKSNMEVCYETTNTNPNSTYIPIKKCLKGYNQYELIVYINSEKISLFSDFIWKKAKKFFARIADNSIMSNNEAIEGLNIKIGESNVLY